MYVLTGCTSPEVCDGLFCKTSQEMTFMNVLFVCFSFLAVATFIQNNVEKKSNKSQGLSLFWMSWS